MKKFIIALMVYFNDVDFLMVIFLKALHILGASLFFGSIISYIVIRLIALNTHVFILPAIKDSVNFLRHNNEVLFEQATLTEATAGAANLLLIVTLIITAVSKERWRKRTTPEAIS